MQMEKAARLRQEWGDKACDHPALVKEYFFGTQTSDYLCTTCGRGFTPEEATELRSRDEQV